MVAKFPSQLRRALIINVVMTVVLGIVHYVIMFLVGGLLVPSYPEYYSQFLRGFAIYSCFGIIIAFYGVYQMLLPLLGNKQKKDNS